MLLSLSLLRLLGGAVFTLSRVGGAVFPSSSGDAVCLFLILVVALASSAMAAVQNQKEGKIENTDKMHQKRKNLKRNEKNLKHEQQ